MELILLNDGLYSLVEVTKEMTAGITLLALGNSAPDTFTDIASVEGGSYPLALNELIGASMFLTTIVFAAVILVSTKKKVKARKQVI